MYAKIFNFKFNGVSEAKVAASFISDAFGKLIVSNNMRSLNISIGKCGSVDPDQIRDKRRSQVI